MTAQDNAADVIQEIIDRQKRPFMTLKSLLLAMGSQLRRRLKLDQCKSNADIKRVLENLIGDRFIFHKKGVFMYIIVPCDPEDLVRAELSDTTPKGLRGLASVLPFSKADVSKILNTMLDSGEAKLIMNENLETRIVLTGTKHERPKREATPEELIDSIKELDRGRIFVKICDLRKKLSWPREVFDAMLRDLRDKEIIQMHIADDTAMTPAEIQDSFVDENNYRMGTVTLNVR